jgi:hypothetical protein
MARQLSFTAEDVLEFLLMLKGGDGGRGLSEGPQTGLIEAIREDRERFGKRTLREPLGRQRTVSQRQLRIGTAVAKKKRKVSAYQREFGRQLKKLKRAHPRTPVTRLMKRAHAATKRARRGK